MNTNVLLRLCAALCVAAISISGCGGGGGDNPKLSVIIAGQVLLTQLAEPQNAQVTVTVGARSFETNTASDGSYQLPIEADESAANQLIAISAHGQSASQSIIEMISYMSSLQSAVSDAGADGRLTADENVRANVTSVSTAEAALADETPVAKSAKSISTGTQLAQALAELDGSKVLDTAAAIKLIAEDPNFSLPEGQDSTLTFARDQADREQFIAEVQDDEAFAEAKSEIVSDPRLIASIAGADLPDPLFITDVPVDEFAIGFQYRFVGFTFDTATTGRYFDSLVDRGMTWSIAGSQLIVTLDQPEVFPTHSANIDCNNDGASDDPVATDTVTGVTISFLGGRTVSRTFAGQTTYANCPGHPSDPFPIVGGTILGPGDFGTLTQAQFANKTVALPIPAGASQLTPGQLQSELFDFGATTGTTLLVPDAFDWSIQQGALVVDFGGGTVYTYRLINTFDSAGSDVLVDATDSVTRLVDAGVSVIVDETLDFVESEIPARYFLGGFGNASVGEFALRLDADGHGAQEDGIHNGPFQQLQWVLEPAGDLLIHRYVDTKTGVGNCDPALPDCQPWDERRIVPLNRLNERFYWLETRRIGDQFSQPPVTVDDSTPPLYISVRRYDRQALSGKAATRPAPRSVPPARFHSIR